jgi:DNA-binding GntR family transcriptional regulator
MGDPSVMTPLQTKIVHALRKRVDLRNRVTVFYEEIAGELGVSKLDVREALIELKDDGFFPGKPSLSPEQFRAHLPA